MLSADCSREARLACLLYRLRSAAEDSEHFLFADDQELFAVDLDLVSGVLAEENAIAILHVNGLSFTLVVLLASTNGDHLTLLRLLFRSVGNDDAATNGLRLIETANQNAVMQRGQLSHVYFDSL